MKPIAISSATLKTFGINDPDVIAYYGYQDEAAAQTLRFAINDIPLDITNYTFEFLMRKQTYDSAADSNKGFDIKGMKPDPLEPELDLSSDVTILDALTGTAQLYISNVLTAEGEDDEGNPTIYAGTFEFRDHASTGELIQKTPIIVIVGE